MSCKNTYLCYMLYLSEGAVVPGAPCYTKGPRKKPKHHVSGNFKSSLFVTVEELCGRRLNRWLSLWRAIFAPRSIGANNLPTTSLEGAVGSQRSSSPVGWVNLFSCVWLLVFPAVLWLVLQRNCQKYFCCFIWQTVTQPETKNSLVTSSFYISLFFALCSLCSSVHFLLVFLEP